MRNRDLDKVIDFYVDSTLNHAKLIMDIALVQSSDFNDDESLRRLVESILYAVKLASVMNVYVGGAGYDFPTPNRNKDLELNSRTLMFCLHKFQLANINYFHKIINIDIENKEAIYKEVDLLAEAIMETIGQLLGILKSKLSITPMSTTH